MSDLEKNIHDWLQTSGYPLEMVVAQALQTTGFSVVQAEFFEDTESDKWRETDVVAYEDHTSDSCRAIFGLVVECKSGTDKPWILFTSKDDYPDSISVTRRATTDMGRSILRSLAFNPEVKNSPLFKVPERPAYGITVGLRKSGQNDYAYGALQSVCKASLGLVRRLDDVPEEMLIPFIWPVILIDAPLYEAFLNDKGVLELNAVEKGMLIWRNPVIARHTLLEVYTKDHFLQSVGDIRSHIQDFLRLAVEENDRHPRQRNSG